MKINIPHAEDARKLIESGEYERAKVQIKKVEEIINSAVSKGLRTVSLEPLEKCVVSKLQEMGYTCKTEKDRNESFLFIYW